MSTDSAAAQTAALQREQAAAPQVIAWAKSQPRSWHRNKFLLAGLVLLVPLIIYGKLDAVSGYYVTTQLWGPITDVWHLLPTLLQHSFRGVIEGVFGGIVLQYHALNAFKDRVLRRWEEYERRLTVRHVIGDLLKVFVVATLAFGVGYALLYADHHNADVHSIFSAMAPSSWLPFHINLEALLTPKVWVRLSAVFVSDTPMMVVGYAAAHLARPRITPVLWELQGYRAARAVINKMPDRWSDSKGFCMRKELFRILGADAAQQEIDEASKTIRFLVPAIKWASVLAFLGGLYIMLVVAQHAVIHLGPIVLH